MEGVVEKWRQVRYVSREEMQEIDRNAIEKHGIPSLTLMENAGRAIAEEIKKDNPLGTPVIVVCGKGKNGGDGFVAARYLHDFVYDVTVILTFPVDELDPNSDSAINLQRIKDLPRISIFKNVDALTVLSAELMLKTTAKPDPDFSLDFLGIGFPVCVSSSSPVPKIVLVDAIFGTGLNKDVDEEIQAIIGKINQYSGTSIDVIGVDIPSGLDADSGIPRPVAVMCKKTVTMGYPKLAFKNPEAKIYYGEVVVADIGLPRTTESQ